MSSLARSKPRNAWQFAISEEKGPIDLQILAAMKEKFTTGENK